MPRHANAHAYVNAGLRMQVDPTTGAVQVLPVMVFGGIGPHAVAPSQTPSLLVGKSIMDTGTVVAAAAQLQQELVPDTPPAAASAAYRQQLAVNLFYKFVVSCLPMASARARSAGEVYERAVSTGTTTFDQGDPTLYPVSQPMPKATAVLQTSGKAVYVNDQPAGPQTLYAAFALASGPPATLAAINVPEGLPGVVRVIQASGWLFV